MRVIPSQQFLSRLLLGLFIFAVVLTLNLSPAQASICRQQGNNHICLLSIKRSAKYYWEYRASVRVNDITYPIEIYNCRQKVRIKADKTVVPFAKDGPGYLICNLLWKD